MTALLWTGILLGLGLVQTFLPTVWAPLGAVDWLLLPVIHQALRSTARRAIVLGAAAGIIQDALSGGLVGLHGFAKTVVAAITAFFGNLLVVRGAVPEGIITGVASLAEGAIVAAWLLTLSRPAVPGPVGPVGRALATGIAAVLVQVGLNWWRRRQRRAAGSRSIG